jgi:hypothetical protein
MSSQLMIFNLLKFLFGNQIKSITDNIEKMSHALEKTHMPNFLSYELGTETIAPNTSATNGFPQPYPGMPMDSYLGRPSLPSSLNGRSTLSMVGPSTHDLRPSRLRQTVRHHKPDSPESHRAHHKEHRRCPE